MSDKINHFLQQYERFGVNLGLERIRRLLADSGNPQERVPIVHVAGTNGKGSVCAYLSAALHAAGYRVGRYTSPHLVDWTERFFVDEQPIAIAELEQILEQIQQTIRSDFPSPTQFAPTQFEIITAAAWLYFAREQVDIAVMEVGLGGRLDATNVCDRPLVTIITSISRDHWQQLGPTLADIAREKAGILKPGCPAVIGPLPPEAQAAVEQRIAELGCPAIFPEPARKIKRPIQAEGQGQGDRGTGRSSFPTPYTLHPTPFFKPYTLPHAQWASSQGIAYPLPCKGEVQLVNSALAIAALQLLRQQGWHISDEQIASGMARTNWPGRLQWFVWSHAGNNAPLLIDGAHNEAAAEALRHYIDSLDLDSLGDSLSNSLGDRNKITVTWLMGMLSSKDHAAVFKALLRSGDRLYLVPVPDRSYADPPELAALALKICPDLDEIRCYPDLNPALEAAFPELPQKGALAPSHRLTVLSGSLYLVGHFLGRYERKGSSG